MKKINAAQGFKLALLGTALAVSGAAYAADTGAPQRHHDRAGHHAFHHHHGHHGFHKTHGFHHGKNMRGERHGEFRRAGLVVPGYGVVSRDFVDGMNLNDDQRKLIEEARKAGKEIRENRKEGAKAMRQARAERIKADTLDPEQALKQSDERLEKMRAERRQIDEKWIAVWKSLDADQQARVAGHLKDRAEKAKNRAEKREERQKQREAARAERAGDSAKTAS